MNRELLNVRLFIIFRVFFNARFYYPVFTILYLDYGLTLEQFSILNIVWALTIVLAEVPSGALADIVGRRNLVVFAGILMVVEMSLLAFVPIGPSLLLFSVFLVNRIFSGLAEAAASGADEALAYDSLKKLGREKEWPHVLEKTVRFMSVGFFIAMITGALAYDHQLLNRGLHWAGFEFTLVRETTIRFPVYLTLFTSCIVLFTTLLMREPELAGDQPAASPSNRIRQSFIQILGAAKWTLNHRFVLFVIIAGLILDSVARQLIILASEYYRTIDIPTAFFGFIGAFMALMGVVYARAGRYLVTHHTPFFIFCLLSAICFTGLVGVSFTIPWIGVIFALMVFSMMSFVTFTQSHYINLHVESKIRATVLSFRGLAVNLGLGLASLLYTLLIAILKGHHAIPDPQELQEKVFTDSLAWFPGYFLILFLAVMIAGKILIRRTHLCFSINTNP